ncbi:MAG: hypothetical protein RLZZ337_991 [Bacteroidota bacterium]|jgi:gliding motility-associated-like protein
MKKFKDISELENLLKSELNQHSVPAPPDVWSAVSSSVTGNSGSIITQFTSYFSSFSNVLKVVLFAGGITAVGVTLYNSNTEKPTTKIPKTTQEDETTAIQLDNEANPLEVISVPEQSQTNTSKSNPTNSSKSDLVTKTNPGNEQPGNAKVPNSTMGANQEPKANETPTAAKSTSKADIELALFASNNNPCKGSTITITNTRKEAGTWMENGKVIAKGSILNYVCKSAGLVNISFQGSERLVNTQIRILATSSTIIESRNGSEFTFSLSDKHQRADWYLDNKKIATNSNGISQKIELAGKRIIKAQITTNSCNDVLTKEIDIKANGSIEFYNIITPNGDGKNDNYIVNIEHYDFFFIKIFDRDNNLIFESQSPDLQWDGNVQSSGIACPNGEYIAKLSYKLTGEELKQKNIKITLIRD